MKNLVLVDNKSFSSQGSPQVVSLYIVRISIGHASYVGRIDFQILEMCLKF